MTIYEIDQRILALADPETGEILDYAAFDALLMEREKKQEGMALWHKNLMAEVKALKAEIDTLNARRSAAEHNAARLANLLEKSLDGEKLSTPRVEVRYHSSSALSVQDASSAAKWLEDMGHADMVTYDAPKIDKRAVASLVKAGEIVPGVELVQRRSMIVR